MFYRLSGAMKRRLLEELKDSFSKHPVYDKVVPFIQDRYSFAERPQYGIVLKGVNANKVSLSADNSLGEVVSHVMLAFFGTPAYPLEWVREDMAVLQSNNDVMPTIPGVYFMEILKVPQNASEYGEYILDPLLDATQEPIIYFQSGVETHAAFQRTPVAGTVRMYENGRYMLKEGTDYSVNYQTSEIRFLTPFNPGARITANYRYAAESIGPVAFQWNTADFKTLPGVVLAFGKRAKKGDTVAIVVTQDRVATAEAFGGKWDMTFELDVISQDPIQREEISDWVMMYLWADKRPFLSNEGIEITDISLGGESEEPMDETGEIIMYTSSLTVQIQTDWELHVPLPFTISKLQPTIPGPAIVGTVPDPSDPTSSAGLIATANNLVFATLPLFAGRNSDFERIK
jgi:hypothetical protein